jgi:hypothetical protein
LTPLYDISLAPNCNLNASGSTNLGVAYVNETGIQNTQVFTGEQYFMMKEIEVFAISLEIHI